MSKESEKLLRAIGDIDDGLIEGAERAKGKKRLSGRILGIAACLAAALSAGVWIRPLRNDITAQPSGSSALSGASSGTWSSEPTPGSRSSAAQEKPSEKGGAGGIGYEEYLVTDIGDLKSANPWTADADLKTLPVFRGTDAAAENGAKEMEAIARAIAEDLDAAVESVKAVPAEGLPEGSPAQVSLGCAGDIVIRVYQDLTARIEFNTPAALPEAYRFGYHVSYEEMTAAGEYLLEEYRRLLHMEKPTLNIYGGNRNRRGEQSFSCYVYEGAGDVTQQILNYHFNMVRFTPDDSGKLWLIDITRLTLSDQLGDFPVYTREEAQSRLEEGHYVTTAPEEFPGADKIAKVELVYRGQGEGPVMPYYRFYAELSPAFWPEGTADGGYPLKSYGAYYVAAVREEALERAEEFD